MTYAHLVTFKIGFVLHIKDSCQLPGDRIRISYLAEEGTKKTDGLAVMEIPPIDDELDETSYIELSSEYYNEKRRKCKEKLLSEMGFDSRW